MKVAVDSLATPVRTGDSPGRAVLALRCVKPSAMQNPFELEIARHAPLLPGCTAAEAERCYTQPAGRVITVHHRHENSQRRFVAACQGACGSISTMCTRIAAGQTTWEMEIPDPRQSHRVA